MRDQISRVDKCRTGKYGTGKCRTENAVTGKLRTENTWWKCRGGKCGTVSLREFN